MNRPPKKTQARQLSLDLMVKPRFGLEDFLVGPSNETAYEMVAVWPDWPDRFLILAGPEGSGKSHLAAIWAEESSATTVPAGEFNQHDPAQLVDCRNLVIEDVDGTAIDETRLFHLMNLVREREAHLLMTARAKPDAWGIRTPDLLSRLRLAPFAEIAPPDDALLRALIVKQFLDRQIIIDTSVVEYVLARIERSFAGVARIVAALDAEALSLGRRITRAVAAKVLERLDESGTSTSF